MDDSSDKRRSSFADVEINNLQYLLRLLSNSTVNSRAYLESIYNEGARHFSATRRFLKGLGWLNELKADIRLTKRGKDVLLEMADDDRFRSQILDGLMNDAGAYARELAHYLIRFKRKGNILQYRPGVSERIRERSVRDFLMGMRIVTHSHSSDTYTLAPIGVDLYLWAMTNSGPTTKAKLQSDSKRKDKLGIAAEIVALEYEKKRVGEKWLDKIEHVSASRPFACYDIKSVTTHGSEATPRYIEVKAVSPDNFQFYWTRTELEVAKLLGGRYFLYLLPVSIDGNFNANKIAIFKDPCSTVYQNTSDWQIEENIIVCKKIRRN